jgi:hypothetical protein
MAAKKPETKDRAAVPGPSPVEQLAALQKSVRLNQYLIIGLAIASIGMGGAALAWTAMTAAAVRKIEPAPVLALNGRIENLEKRISSLFARQDEFQFKVEATFAAVDEIRNQRQQRDFAPIQQVLVEQRTDYNDMLAILNTGVLALANMLHGSRAWTADYTKRIEHAMELNKQRIAAIQQLPNDAGKKTARLPVKLPAATSPATPATPATKVQP